MTPSLTRTEDGDLGGEESSTLTFFPRRSKSWGLVDLYPEA